MTDDALAGGSALGRGSPLGGGSALGDGGALGDGDAPLRVSTLELFFDLVFVFAITQLTGILSHEVSVEDGFRVLLVFGALWWMYGGYVWLANARTPARTTERLLMLAGMAGFLIMGLAIPEAFGRDGVALGIGYLIVVLIHGWLYQRVNRNIARVSPFNLVAALLVIPAGIVKGGAAYALWAAAPLTSPAVITSSAATRLNGATRAMFLFTRWYSQPWMSTTIR